MTDGFPLTKGTITRQAHVNLPKGTYEEEHGRDGFYGPVSHLYRTHPPTGWTRVEGPLKPRAFDTAKLKPDNNLADGLNRTKLLYNDEVAIHLATPSKPMDFFYRNADGDEVIFIHEGAGTIETDYGPLDYKTGDYLVIPRGTTFRLLPNGKKDKYLVIESFSRIQQPDRGLMGQHALYDPAMIDTPNPDPQTDDSREWEVRIKRQDEFTSVFYPFHPIDVVGWKGDLTVWKLSIHDINPVMSHRYHLAPSVHSTFLGTGFIICSFVPRPLEEEEGAMRVPFFHRNIDYNEFIFYHDGDFFSRDGINAGMITLHPQGIHHGPHPNAIEGSKKKERTDEVAVMVDTVTPLQMTDAAKTIEWPEYHMSWQDLK